MTYGDGGQRIQHYKDVQNTSILSINKNFIDNYDSDYWKIILMFQMNAKDRVKDNNLKNVERYNFNLMTDKYKKLKVSIVLDLNNLSYKVLKKQQIK